MKDIESAEFAEARKRLGELMIGGFVNQIIYVAARLGIADLLADQPRTLDELARATGGKPRILGAVMRALETLDVFALDAGGRYHLLPMGSVIRSYPGWRSQALLFGEEYFRCSGELLHTVTTGELAFNHAFGMPFYDYFARNQEAAARFNQVMTLSAPLRYADVPTAYDFSRAELLIDVGAGHGGLTAIVLKAWPHLRAILFDSQPVTSGALRHIAAQGLTDRCDVVAGDFFESVPGGGDAYLLASVVVNWDDDRALALLRNCRRAMDRSAALLIVEHAFLDGHPPSPFAAVAAVAGYVLQGSVTRTETEYRALLTQSGFRVAAMRALQYEPYAMIHAVPV
jgi:O-methyltransferase domain